jgi:hypothetical protein
MVAEISNLRSVEGMSSQAGIPASDITTTSNGCQYSDGSQYGVCQVEAKGWPMPKFFGGKSRSRRRSKSMRRSKSKARRARRAGSSCSMSKTGGKARRVRKAGGLINQAIVPFGLLAAQKKSQRRHKHGHGKKHRRKSFRKKR